MDGEVVLLLAVGGTIALVSSLLTALAYHLLSLRTDRIRRERENEAQRAEALRDTLKKRLEGATEAEGVLNAWARRPSETDSPEPLVSQSAIEEALREG
jgi:hypothetical protein